MRGFERRLDMSQYNQPQLSAPTSTKKKKSFWTDQISTGTGIGGALGGAAAGAAAGSVVPGVGTAIGGILGALIGGGLASGAGEIAENKITGDDWDKNVLNETLIGGATSLPVGAGFKLLRAGGKAALGQAGARELVQEAGMKTIGRGTVAKGGRFGTQFDDEAMAALSRMKGGTAGKAAGKTTATGRLAAKGDKALADQYGALSKPTIRSTNPAETVRELADMGITKPQDAERMAQAITGADGLLNRQVVKAVGKSGSVDTSGLRRVLDDAMDNQGIVDTDRKKLAKIFQAEMGKLNGGARGTLGGANPTDTLSTMKSLERRIADLRGKGNNYRMTTPEREDMANALQLVRDELQDRLYGAAGGNKNLQRLMTPEFRKQLVDLMPNNKAWVKHVDENIMTAGDVGSIRSLQRPFVGIQKIIDEADDNAFSVGGKMTRGAQGIREAILQAGGDMVANPARRGFAGATRALQGAGGRAAGDVGQRAVPLGIRQALGSAIFNDGGNQPAIDPALAAQGVDPMTGQPLGGDMGMTEQPQAEPSIGGITRSQLQEAMMMAAMDGNTDAYKQLEMMMDLMPSAQGQDLSAAQQKAMIMAANGENAINQMETLLNEAGGGSGSFLGGLRGKLPGELDPSAKLYNDSLGGIIDMIAKARGKTDALSEADRDLIMLSLPQISDTPENAARKIAMLKQSLQVARQNALSGGIVDEATQQ